jgi:hypothetical protein
MNRLAELARMALGLVGYIPAAQALAQGFTHHGKYFGLPIWLTAEEGPAIACKWAPLEHLLPVVMWIEGTLRELFFPEREPAFQILQGPAIKRPGAP